MIETPRIVQTVAQLTAIVPVTVARSEIRTVMGPGISELMATVASQHIAPAGPWFTHHLRTDPQVFEFEISVPVTAPIQDRGRVRPGLWPAMKVVRTVYQGPYEGMGQAWGEFDAWISAQGLKASQDFWEVYAVGPESGSDPTLWRTEFSRRLLD
ncbi:AraC family transcriptional regulator [Corallococcus sp. CA053C]|uniref:GyrI-like domain-containing protein n=1 Tax=Corallococcus sp. CA053C TaxID=2316732 RepID=UPI000EA166AC|nr:GyrI-like domain-containing protein [Corallococcus sp. CA053C]RKH15070.1 AraC family transcriptional regulator [Corallococcus sp. CA053C]